MTTAPHFVFPARTSLATPPAIAPAEPSALLQKLRGRWQRPDGGYVIEIHNIAADGKRETFNYNPRSIHIARAEASQSGDTANDQLADLYFQAVQRGSFYVAFHRLPDKARP